MNKYYNEYNDKKSKFVLDLIVGIVALACIVVCLMFRGCSLDIIVAILSLVIIVAGTVFLTRQDKQIEKL